MSLSPFARSPLTLVDHAVGQLSQPAAGFTIDPAELGIPGEGRRLSVRQVRDVLSHRDTPIAVKNRAWAALITRAQRGEPVWTLAALGIALPRLHRLGRELAPGYRGSHADLDAEILTGFLAALAGARTDHQRRFPALVRAARLAGLAWTRHCRLAATESTGHHPVTTAAATTTNPPRPRTTAEATAQTAINPGVNTHRPWVVNSAVGHPDLVLADAVAAGILTGIEAEIIASTRLEHRPLRVVAAAHELPVKTLWMRRDRAEKRLVTALTRALAADDTDRAHDPTHAQLLAATPLAQRLHQPAVPPHPTAATSTGRRHTGHDPDTQRGRDHSPRGHSPRGRSPRRPRDGHPRDERPGRAGLSGDQAGPGHDGSDTGHDVTGGQPADGAASSLSRPAGVPAHHRAPARPRVRRCLETSTASTASGRAFPPLTAPLIILLITIPLLVTGRVSRECPGHTAPPAGLSSPSAAIDRCVTALAVTTDATALPGASFTIDAATRSVSFAISHGLPTSESWASYSEGDRSRRSVRRPARSGRPNPLPAQAAAPGNPDGTAQLTRVLSNIRNWLMGVLITLATLCLTIGGVRYLIAGGDPGEVEAAKRAIKSAAIGYTLAALAPALVAVLRTLVGV
jgi:hypothetical protein